MFRVAIERTRPECALDISRLIGPSQQKLTERIYLLTSTSGSTVTTKKSKSEFFQPTKTPGPPVCERSSGQKIRRSPSFMTMLPSNESRKNHVVATVLSPRCLDSLNEGADKVSIARRKRRTYFTNQCSLARGNPIDGDHEDEEGNRQDGKPFGRS